MSSRRSVFTNSFENTRIIEGRVGWKVKARTVLNHIAYEITWVAFVIFSIVFCAFRDNLMFSGDQEGMLTWTLISFIINGVFLADMIIHCIVYGT